MASFLNTLRVNFLHVDKYTFGNTWVYPESFIPYGMLRYVLHGSACFLINGEEYLVERGDVAYIPEGCMLSCRAVGNNFSFVSIRFSLSLHMEQEDILQSFWGVHYVTHCQEYSDRMSDYFHHVLNSALGKSPAKIFFIHGYLELILACLSEHSEEPVSSVTEPRMEYDSEYIKQRAMKSARTIDPRIQVVSDYLTHNPTQHLQIERLCALCNMSETSLRRNFKKHTGKTLGDFLNELRMVNAARRLLVTDEHIAIIAYELGYQDANYFSRRFKETYGVSPQQYRKSARE